MPYWMLVAAGLGIFLGCVGKSAQFPLQVWLPDAMEGPTPVSALIHAATMVAAGVYLVGRCYPLFTPEVLLVIAYVGGITLFVAATIAVVMTDIKKVLAYSTVSQLGYMMLALGVGGWVAGLFHLITHAFFKALLFLGSGSVIYGCHHEQDMRKMGGLYPKMKITALSMLMGVLAIAGVPLFTGWYSKDAILAQAIGFVTCMHSSTALLFVLPLMTAGITTFYMFRMWLMTFTGKPRDQHVYEHAHESPALMTVPLIALAVMSVCVAWGWPVWPTRRKAGWRSRFITRNRCRCRPSSAYCRKGRDPTGCRAAAGGPRTLERPGYGPQLAGNLVLGMVAASASSSPSCSTTPARARPGRGEGAVPRRPSLPGAQVVLRRVVQRSAGASGSWSWPLVPAFDLGVIDGIIHFLARLTVRVAKLGRSVRQGR